MAEDPFGWVGHDLNGRYQALAVAGEGGFGVVYRGHHLSLGVDVAIKCLKVPQSLPDGERKAFEQRFIEEGRVLHRLSRASSGVVQALDVGSAMSPLSVWTPYLVLEWLNGKSLEQEMHERAQRGQARWSLRSAIEMLTPAARALQEAHAQRVAHRDIKPANLFLAEVGDRQTLKVLDFGIAKVIQESLSHTEALRKTGQAMPAFTPQYGAPEQFDRRKGATGTWTDVHALGLVLFEMLTGVRAFEGDDLVHLMACALDKSRPSVRTHGVEVDDAFEAVLRRALALLPEDRYATAGAFWGELLVACPEAAPEEPSFSAASRSAARDEPAQAGGAMLDTASFLAELDSGASPEGSAEPSAELDTGAWLAQREGALAESAELHSQPPVGPASAEPASAEPASTADAPAASSVERTTDREVSTPRSERRPAAGAPRWQSVALALLTVAVVALALRSALDTPPDPTAADPDTSATPSPSTTPSSTVPFPEASATAETAEETASAKPAGTGSTAPRKTSVASGGVAASAGADEPIAPADYCAGASCKVDGECTAALVGKVVVCTATSDGDCKKSYGCSVHGQCWARGGQCKALSQADCDQSSGCKQTGECSLRNGKCLQELITDCTKYPVCKQLGMCTARDNACFATSDAHCRASMTCTQSGNCRADGTKCVP